MEQEKSDCELMVLSQRGDDSAFEIIVNRYSRRLINFFYKLCWYRETSEDLAQEVFVKLYKNMGSYKPSGNFTSYIYTIARNTWIDAIRCNRIQPESKYSGDSSEIFNNISCKQFEPSEILEYKEKLEKVKRTISSLSEEQKLVFVLYEQDMKYAQIAETLGIPEGTVKSRLHSVFNKLKEAVS